MYNRLANSRRTAIAAFAAIAVLPKPAASADLAVLPGPTASAYTMHEDSDTPDGSKHVDQHMTIAGHGTDYVATIVMGSAAPSVVHLTFAAGELQRATAPAIADPDDDAQRVSSTIGALTLLVGATQNAPPSIASGSQWQSTVTLALPGGETATIPLAMTAQSVRGTDVRLAGIGSGSGTIRGHGHTLKAQVAVAITADAHAGRIANATVATSITGHVFIKTLSFKDTWTFAP